MRRSLAGIFVALAVTMSMVSLAGAQTTPRFQQGFAAVAQMIPDVVGTPIEDEHSSPVTGDSIQRTTTGVFVWRKADNVTAFTDGGTTWLLGPEGLQARPNSARFNWERSAIAGVLPQDAVTINFARSGPIWEGEGTVHNTLTVPVDVEINATGYDTLGGRPVVDAPSVYIFRMPAGATRTFTIQVHAPESVGHWAIRLLSNPVSARSDFSVDVGTTGPLEIDAELAGAVETLRQTEQGLWLLRVSAEHGVVVMYDDTDPGILGTFDPFSGEVVVSTRLDEASSWVRAAVLAHELSHAHNAAAGNRVRSPLQCYQEEAQAFKRQAEIWSTLWRGQLPDDLISPYHEELNDITTTVLNDPETFVEQLVRRYRSECGPLSQNPTAILP